MLLAEPQKYNDDIYEIKKDIDYMLIKLKNRIKGDNYLVNEKLIR